jgi:hypothetical protein
MLGVVVGLTSGTLEDREMCMHKARAIHVRKGTSLLDSSLVFDHLLSQFLLRPAPTAPSFVVN